MTLTLMDSIQMLTSWYSFEPWGEAEIEESDEVVV